MTDPVVVNIPEGIPASAMIDAINLCVRAGLVDAGPAGWLLIPHGVEPDPTMVLRRPRVFTLDRCLPDVTHVIDRRGVVWEHVRDTLWRDSPQGCLYSWRLILDEHGPLTDVTPRRAGNPAAAEAAGKHR